MNCFVGLLWKLERGRTAKLTFAQIDFLILGNSPLVVNGNVVVTVNDGLLDIWTELAVPFGGQQILNIVVSRCLHFHQPRFTAA